MPFQCHAYRCRKRATPLFQGSHSLWYLRTYPSHACSAAQAVKHVPKGGEAEPTARVTFPEGRPKGIVHFIGGAVVGAAPQLSYKCALTSAATMHVQICLCTTKICCGCRFFINRMASNGYTVVQTPYPFTFSHESLANDLFQVRSRACICCLFVATC